MNINRKADLKTTQGPETFFTGKVVTWMKKVTDAEYRAPFGKD